MLFFVTANNVLVPIMNASHLDKVIMLLFNFAMTSVSAFASISIIIANNLWNNISNAFWSTPMITGITCGVSCLILYVFYDITQNILEKLSAKFNAMEEEIKYYKSELTVLNSIINDLEWLNLDTKPTKDLNDLEIENRDEKMRKLELILEKIKRERELSKLIINVELTKKIN